MIDYFLLIKNSKSPKRFPGQTTLDQIEPKWRRAHDLARPLRLWEEKLWRSRCPGESSNLGVLMIVLKGAGKETPTSLPRIGGGKDQHWITWLCHLDDHHKGNDHYLSPGWSWSPQGKWSLSSKQASTHGKRTSSPSARGSREPWKCSGEEVEEDSAFLQEPSPLASQVVLNYFRSLIYVWKLKPSTSLFRFKPFLSTSTPRARGRSAKALVAGYKGGIQCFW